MKKHFSWIMILTLVALGMFALGSHQKAKACFWYYTGYYNWLVASYCIPDSQCDDINGEPCWKEDCARNNDGNCNLTTVGANWYDCDDNCSLLEYCVSCY